MDEIVLSTIVSGDNVIEVTQRSTPIDAYCLARAMTKEELMAQIATEIK